jgi:hypothetical protein
VNEERADLEVIKIRRERAAEIRAEKEQRAAREREVERAALDEKREAERAAARDAERRRLAELREFGRTLALYEPTKWQAAVTRDLETFVSPEQFPADLNPFTARTFVRARVEQVLGPLREQREAAEREARAQAAAEREKAERKRRRRSLIEAGVNRCFWATLMWDPEDREEARSEVEDALESELEAGWADSQVAELVDGILADWEADD